VGYGRSRRINDPVDMSAVFFRPYLPDTAKKWTTLTPLHDIVMSAKCMIKILGGDPEKMVIPANVPTKLAESLIKYAQVKPDTSMMINAWSIHQELGRIADAVYGSPMFIPIKVPR
jgi:hypothetical protein